MFTSVSDEPDIDETGRVFLLLNKSRQIFMKAMRNVHSDDGGDFHQTEISMEICAQEPTYRDVDM